MNSADQLALIRRITGDPYWGRTVRKCPECAGEGDVTFLKLPEDPRPRGTTTRCTTCQGHGVVFREDTEGRELIAEAVADWCFQSPKGREIALADAESFIDIWSIRQGQPCEKALEQHVREYEPVLPDDYLTAHGGERLKGFLREAGYSYRTGWPHRTGLSDDPAADKHVASIRDFRRVGGSWYAEADTEAAALLEAVREAFPEGL